MSMRSASSASCRLRAALVVLCALSCAYLACQSAGVQTAQADTINAINRARLDSTVRYLQNAQNMDGGFGADAGAPSNPDFSAWTTFALAADGINPQDQRQPGGTDAFTYLAEHATELRWTTDFERALLVVDASGTSPHDFGGIELVGEILGRALSSPGQQGAFAHEAGGRTAGINDTIYAILALSPIAEPVVQAAVQQATDWLLEVQDADGGWPEVSVCSSNPRTCPSEVDMTGAAIEALNAAGRHDTGAQAKAFSFLHGAQDENGGFPEHVGEGEPNVASTAWAVQGIWSANENPETWTIGPAGAEPLGYMASLQQPDGHIRWKTSQDLNGLWMTAEVAPAFAGQPLPVPPPPRQVPSPPPQPGDSGVIAGGGGEGAPLFSRPQPQSRGKTPGGVRLLGVSEAHARHHAVKAPRRTTAPTETSSAPTASTTPSATARGPVSKHHAGTPCSAADAQKDGKLVNGTVISLPHSTSGEPGAPGLHSAFIDSDRLTEALASVAESLRVPVLVLALAALLFCALELGRFATELWLRRSAGRQDLHELGRLVVADPARAAALCEQASSRLAGDALLAIARAILAGRQTDVEHALADYELAVQRRLDRTRILVRAGPALGLMGTLIPLAPGLAALGHGDVSVLAGDLRSAFAATTIGLLVGTVAFSLTLIRTRMYSEDLTALERTAGDEVKP